MLNDNDDESLIGNGTFDQNKKIVCTIPAVIDTHLIECLEQKKEIQNVTENTSFSVKCAYVLMKYKLHHNK